MATKVFKDLSTVVYGAVPIDGALEMSYSGGDTPQTQRSDGGTLTHYVTKGAISGSFSFTDYVEAELMASKVAAGTDVKFAVTDEIDAPTTVTVNDFKSGGVSGGFTSSGVSSFNVPFTATTVTGPA